MGEGCFHPQLGFIDKLDNEKKEKNESINQDVSGIKNTLEENLVECSEKPGHFDYFCGKAQSLSEDIQVEVWIDNSASMRNVDYSSDMNFCQRRWFVSQIKKSCARDKLAVSTFNTSKKRLGGPSNLCLSHGSNDQDRFITWIKNTNVKKLFVVTDREEMNSKMKEFLDLQGAQYYGINESKTVDSFENFLSLFKNWCS